MKTIFVGMIAFLFSLNIQAQNKNVMETTQTTTTTVKNSDGNKRIIKKENVREVQNIELKAPTANTINVEMKDSPVVSTTTTKITKPDGNVSIVDVDRSSYYLLKDKKYQLVPDGLGYKMSYKNKRPALLRKTAAGNYVYSSRNKTAIGYFDGNGNLILDTYDYRSDKISSETYLVVRD